MTEPVSDFRSDTVTQPTPAMRRAMAEAVVGDDVLDGDPTVRGLEETAARWLGKDGAWFVPSGTMANQVAAGAWTRSGDEVIAEADAHVVLYESGAFGYLHGLQTTTLRANRGAFDPEELRRALRPDLIHCPKTALICVEQTNLESGGRVVPLDNLREVRAIAAEHEIPVHMDGARLANAVAASGISASEWAACADSVSVCLSKGLGAPVGSIVAGDAEFLERAKLVRKRLGGWMRQAGVIAAAGRIALEEGAPRLGDDHLLARGLAERVHALPGLSCPPGDVETNILFIAIEDERFDAAALIDRLEEHGVRALLQSDRSLRAVTHRDVGPSDVERFESALRAILTA